MSKPVIALQLYTVRDFTQEDLKGTLTQLKDFGYNYVELAGMYNLPATEFKAMLDEIGLTAISAHVPIQAFEQSVEGTVADYKTVGCKFIGIPWLDKSQLPGGENWPKYKALLQEAAAACKAAGITPMYHNHAHEFDTLPDGTYILDQFFNELPEYETEIDTGWVHAVDLCPAEYITKYSGRTPVVHLKDTHKIEKIDKPTGQGTQDMPGITKAAVASGAQVLVAELDAAVGLTSMEAAQQSLAFLQGLGF